MTAILAEEDIRKLLSATVPLMKHVHVVQESFELQPDKLHHGACIDYIDLQESRQEFCQELINTVLDWVYSQEKAKDIMDKLQRENRSENNAQSALFQMAKRKFRPPDGRALRLQGQFGELLIFNFLQHLFKAAPLLRKMSISTSRGVERHGADAIHYASKDGKHLFFLGESKSYASSNKFSTAFKDAVASILTTYHNHRNELDLYIYEDFLSPQLQEIASAYKNGELDDVEVHMVAVVVYNETSDLAKKSEKEIKEAIMTIVRDRSRKLDKAIFANVQAHLLPRLNYIIMPIWELDNLIKLFQDKLGI
jgi:hypothetical protein